MGDPSAFLSQQMGSPATPENAAGRSRSSRALREERELVVITRPEIENLADTGDLIVLLKQKRAFLAASGGAV